MLSRRQFLVGSAAASVAGLSSSCRSRAPWEESAYRKRPRSRVAVLRAENYLAPLADVLQRGLKLFSLNLQGKRIVLKPNLVEYDPAGVINTHPAVIYAAIEAFRSLGAQEVIVAEGPGHRRDNEYLLIASGLYDVLKDTRATYVDLNQDDVRSLKVRSHFTGLESFYLPETVLSADLLVSMPKLKTHHWAGVTLSMKNMFGIIPGAVYGWPKNILHWVGIHQSILDINGALPVPQFAIVDGIVGMEGNGPIQGAPKRSGVLVLGDDLVAVDATAARLMRLEPQKIRYLEKAAQFLGNMEVDKIQQVGERYEPLRQDFQVIDSFQNLKSIAGS